MGGRASKRKGDGFERAIVQTLNAYGLDSQRVPLSGAAGGEFSGDIISKIRGKPRKLECKIRNHGFTQLYRWLVGMWAVVVRQDRAEPLIVMRLTDFLDVISEDDHAA